MRATAFFTGGCRWDVPRIRPLASNARSSSVRDGWREGRAEASVAGKQVGGNRYFHDLVCRIRAETEMALQYAT